MFDKNYTVHRRTEHVPFTKEVHEYRAPTDQSIEILNEMQDKVMKNMVAQLRLSGSTDITELVATIQYQPWNLETTLFYKFRINGTNMDGKVPCHGRPDIKDHDAVEAMIKLLIKDMSEKIAKYYSEYIIKACLINAEGTVEFNV